MLLALTFPHPLHLFDRSWTRIARPHFVHLEIRLRTEMKRVEAEIRRHGEIEVHVTIPGAANEEIGAAGDFEPQEVAGLQLGGGGREAETQSDRLVRDKRLGMLEIVDDFA